MKKVLTEAQEDAQRLMILCEMANSAAQLIHESYPETTKELKSAAGILCDSIRCILVDLRENAEGLGLDLETISHIRNKQPGWQEMATARMRLLPGMQAYEPLTGVNLPPYPAANRGAK